MKRLILSVFSLLIVSISTVFAAIPDSEFAIGGITFDANTNVVTGIFSTANNGLTTPAGLTVGMDADAIEQAYGEPWKNDRGYISYHEEGKWLVFTTHNGKITEIKLFDYVV